MANQTGLGDGDSDGLGIDADSDGLGIDAIQRRLLGRGGGGVSQILDYDCECTKMEASQ